MQWSNTTTTNIIDNKTKQQENKNSVSKSDISEDIENKNINTKDNESKETKDKEIKDKETETKNDIDKNDIDKNSVSKNYISEDKPTDTIEEEKEIEDEDVFEVNLGMNALFDDNDTEEEDYDGAKRKILSEIKDNLCSVKKGKLGLELDELVFVKEHTIYMSFRFLSKILSDTKKFIKEAIEKKELKIKNIKLENKNYEVKMVTFKDDIFGLDVSNVNCDEVVIEEER